MNDRLKKEFLSGVLEGIAQRVSDPDEFLDEVKRMLPGVKIVSSVKIGGNCEEGKVEGDDKGCDDSDHENICECSQCHFNRGLRKLEEEAKERGVSHKIAFVEAKSKFGDNIDKYLSFYSSLALTKREVFKELNKAITEYRCACITMEAVKRNIEEIKSGTK